MWIPDGVAREAGARLLPADGDAVERARRLVEEELSKHGSARLAKARLDRVCLGRGLRAGGRKVSGLALPLLGWLLLDATEDEATLRLSMHHELFHLLDERLARDPEWEAKNPRGFRYDRLYGQSAGPDPTTIDRSRPGFLSWYSRSSAAEDKAEVFAFLAVQPDATRKAADDDRVLSAKVSLLEARLGPVGR